MANLSIVIVPAKNYLTVDIESGSQWLIVHKRDIFQPNSFGFCKSNEKWTSSKT